MRTRTSLLSLLALGLITASAAQAASTLKEVVIVTGEMVTLGDLVTEAGPAAGTIVAVAPPPGETLAFAGDDVAAAAREHGVTLADRPLAARIVVERAAKIVGTREIGDAIARELMRRGAPGPLGIDLGGRRIEIKLPVHAEADIEILSLDFDQTTGRFWANLRAPAGDPRAERLQLIGRADRIAQVPMLKAQLPMGAVIAASDIELRPQPMNRLAAAVVTDPQNLVGMALRRPMAAATPISSTDIEKPQAVQRNALVTMIYVKPGIALTTTGRAMEPGAMGDMVHVQNTKSNRTVEATVTGVNEVTIRSRLDGLGQISQR